MLCYRQLLFSVYGRQVHISNSKHLQLNIFDIWWGPKGRSFRRRRKGRRIPGLPHHFPCGCSELGIPGSQHIARMPYPRSCKPQKELSSPQFLHWAHICECSCMPRQGDNHISGAWAPLWWDIMLSWFLHREANSQKSQVSSSLTLCSAAMQVCYSLHLNNLNLTIPEKQSPGTSSNSFWLLQQ